MLTVPTRRSAACPSAGTTMTSTVVSLCGSHRKNAISVPSGDHAGEIVARAVGRELDGLARSDQLDVDVVIILRHAVPRERHLAAIWRQTRRHFDARIRGQPRGLEWAVAARLGGPPADERVREDGQPACAERSSGPPSMATRCSTARRPVDTCSIRGCYGPRAPVRGRAARHRSRYARQRRPAGAHACPSASSVAAARGWTAASRRGAGPTRGLAATRSPTCRRRSLRRRRARR